jgi:hypothetical protein
MGRIFTILLQLFLILSLFSPIFFAQENSLVNKNRQSEKIAESLFTSDFAQRDNFSYALVNSKLNTGLRLKYWVPDNVYNLPSSQNSFDDDYIPWESNKHFWVAVGEIAILEFIPWALARWGRDWEDPADNWAKVSSETWWKNISHGWEYDGDAFVTNNFAHPYHGALFFNAGRTNGYDFWESSAWALTGSAIWEYFGETFRPAFNDWIFTGVGGSNLGEVLYRLSSMVTDNSASGSERVWSEIFGTLINPIRGFNRAITGEMGKNYPNPEWSRPDDFLISFNSGIRTLDKNGDKDYRDNETEGLFAFDLTYGNKFDVDDPFSFFTYGIAISSSEPLLTGMYSSGYLFGWELSENKHRFNVDLEFDYTNIIRDNTNDADSILFMGILYGDAAINPNIYSIFAIGEKTNIITQFGIDLIIMAGTPNDYYLDIEGRNYDYGPGFGLDLSVRIVNGIWNYVNLSYQSAWIFTQTQILNFDESAPLENAGFATHFIRYLRLDLQYPLTKYLSFGVGFGIYWRESYYDFFPDVSKNHPILRIFFRTAIIDI